MHHRVRWENVIRAAAASLLVAVVVAWPRLAPPEPRLPAPEAAPLVGDEPIVEPAPAAPSRRSRRRASARGAARIAGGGRPRRRGADGAVAEPSRPARTRRRATDGEARPAGGERRRPATSGGGPATSGPAPSAAPPTPAPDPAQTEFGFEGG